MKFNVTTNIDPELIEKRVPKADHDLAVMAQKDTEKFVPYLTGNLANSTKVIGSKIFYPGPYAHYLYEGKSRGGKVSYGKNKKLKSRNLVFNKASHPLAQDHWFEASKALNMEKWEKAYKESLK